MEAECHENWLLLQDDCNVPNCHTVRGFESRGELEEWNRGPCGSSCHCDLKLQGEAATYLEVLADRAAEVGQAATHLEALEW